MTPLKTEGIIIQALNFRDYDVILTVFTESHGMVKMFFKGGNSTKRKKGGTTAPFTRAEFIFKEGKSDLYSCNEVHVLAHYLDIRKSMETLEAGCDLLKMLLTSQPLEKPAPLLYKLLVMSLERVAKNNIPKWLTANFAMKVLKHEGLISFDDICSECQSPLVEVYISQGECFCTRHAPLGATPCHLEQLKKMQILIDSKNFAELTTFVEDKNLFKLIKEVFNSQF